MATNNLNKIIRGNLQLKPWLFGKNTASIVNSCVDKIYKQIPKLKNDTVKLRIAAAKPKMAAVRTENKAPVRLLRSRERINLNLIPKIVRPSNKKNSPTNLNSSSLLNAIMANRISGSKPNSISKKAVGFGLPRKHSRTPSLAISYSSNNNGSRSSILRQHDDRNSRQIQSKLNYSMRSFGSDAYHGSQSLEKATMPLVFYPPRNQRMTREFGHMSKTLIDQPDIGSDLMSVTNSVKDRIAVARPKLVKGTKPISQCDPLSGWNHPPPPDLFSIRGKEMDDANANLNEYQRRALNNNKEKQFELVQKMKSRELIGRGSVGKRRGNEELMSKMYVNTAHETATRVPQQKPTMLNALSSLRFTGKRGGGGSVNPAPSRRHTYDQTKMNVAYNEPTQSFPTAQPTAKISTPNTASTSAAATAAGAKPVGTNASKINQTARNLSVMKAAIIKAAKIAAPQKILRTTPIASATSTVASNVSRFSRTHYHRGVQS